MDRNRLPGQGRRWGGKFRRQGFLWRALPHHLSGIGDFNICGFKRPQSYYHDLLWGVRTAPFITVLDPQHHGKPMGFTPWGWEPVLDTWTFPGQEGRVTQVDVYSIDEEVEVLVNGVSAGRKPAGATSQNKVSFERPTSPEPSRRWATPAARKPAAIAW